MSKPSRGPSTATMSKIRVLPESTNVDSSTLLADVTWVLPNGAKNVIREDLLLLLPMYPSLKSIVASHINALNGKTQDDESDGDGYQGVDDDDDDTEDDTEDDDSQDDDDTQDISE